MSTLNIYYVMRLAHLYSVYSSYNFNTAGIPHVPAEGPRPRQAFFRSVMLRSNPKTKGSNHQW